VATIGKATFANLDDNGLSEIGRLNDATFLYVDWGIGYWSHRRSLPDRWLTGLAWTSEIHWNRSLQDADAVVAGNSAIGCGGGNTAAVGDSINVLDVNLGTHLEFRANTLMTLAYAVPIDTGNEQLFDGEFRLLLNHHYGPGKRRMRAAY
jgi:hypothetical protein